MSETIFSTLKAKFKKDSIYFEDVLQKAYGDYISYDYTGPFMDFYDDEYPDEEMKVETEAFGLFVNRVIKHHKISDDAKEFICRHYLKYRLEFDYVSNPVPAVEFLIARDQFDFSDHKLIWNIFISFDRRYQPKEVESKVKLIKIFMKNKKLSKQFKLKLPNYIFTSGFCDKCPGDIFNAYISSDALSNQEKLKICDNFIGKQETQNEISLPSTKELLQNSNKIGLKPEDIKRMNQDELLQAAISLAVQKDQAENPWRTVSRRWVSESINRYSVLWYGRLCPDPKKFIKSLKEKKFGKQEQGYVDLGVLDLIIEIRNKLNQEYIQKIIKEYSEHPVGMVRQQAYIYGYNIISEDFTRQGLYDPNKGVADFIDRFLKRGGKLSKGGRPKRKR